MSRRTIIPRAATVVVALALLSTALPVAAAGWGLSGHHYRDLWGMGTYRYDDDLWDRYSRDHHGGLLDRYSRDTHGGLLERHGRLVHEGLLDRHYRDHGGYMARMGFAVARIVHAASDAPAVDVWVDGKMAATNLAFGEATRYMRVPAGTYDVQIVPTGEREPVVLAAEITLMPRSTQTIAAIGSVSDLGAVVLDDSTRPRGNNAHVRFVHASADAPAVDIAAAGGAPIFADVSYGESSDYTPIPQGMYDLEARLAGTDTVALAIPDVPIRGGTAYTAYAVGMAGDGSLNVLLTKDMGRR